jgi:uncharacterized membrane protein
MEPSSIDDTRLRGAHQKTVAKWKKRETITDLPTGPKEAKSTVLSIEDEAIIAALGLGHLVLSLGC